MKRLAHHLRVGRSAGFRVPRWSSGFARRRASDVSTSRTPHIPARPGRRWWRPSGAPETSAGDVRAARRPRRRVGYARAPAVRWAAENGVLRVPTTPPTTPTSSFIASECSPHRCDRCSGVLQLQAVATPSYAAAEHLTEMGVPRAHGFFPRGQPGVLPKQRSLEFRANVFGVGSGTTRGGNRRRSKTAAIAGTRMARLSAQGGAHRPREGFGLFVRPELFAPAPGARVSPVRVVVAGDGPDLPWMRRQLDHLPEVRSSATPAATASPSRTRPGTSSSSPRARRCFRTTSSRRWPRASPSSPTTSA